MARYNSEQQRHEAESFKGQMVEALHETDIKQEAIANDVGTTQPTVSRWFSYLNTEFPDLFQLSKFPPVLLTALLNVVLKPLGLAVTRPKPAVRDLNGSMDDELLNIDVIQADIIRVKDQDPKKAKKHIADLHGMLDKLDAECDLQIAGGSLPAGLRKIMD